MAFPHIATRDDVIAQDATQNAYSVTLMVVAGKRYAIGLALLSSSSGQQATFLVNNASIGTRTTSNTNLANRSSLYFEDGIVWESDTSGEVEFTVRTSTPNSFKVEGVIIREPSAKSGIVEDQGSGTHSYPIAAVFGGNKYQMHAEMYTGRIFLSVNDTPQGEQFPQVAGDYNERYHNSVFVIPVSTGVVIGRSGHNKPNLDIRYLPAGVVANRTAIVNLAAAGTAVTYCRAVVTADDEVIIVIRGAISSNTAASQLTAVIVRDVADLGTAGHTVIEDVITTGHQLIYPVAVEIMDDGDGNEIVVVMAVNRNSNRWFRTHVVLYAPGVGANGRWYSIEGHVASNANTRGTPSSPRFSTSQRDTITLVGDGIIVLGGQSGVQRYPIQGILTRITQWPDADTAAKADISWPYCSQPSLPNDYGDTTYRWCIISGGVFSEGPTDFTVPPILTANSYRQFGAIYEDSEGVKRLIITNRGTRLATNLFGETTDHYYDWGTTLDIRVFIVEDEFDPELITFTLEGTHELGTQLTAGWMTRIYGTESIIYEEATNELHPTHRQSNTAAAFNPFIPPPPDPDPDPTPTGAAYYVHVGGVTPKVVAWTWVANSAAVTTTGATIDIQSIAGVSLIGGPQPAVINSDARQHRYEHPTNVMTRNNVYWLIFTATINSELLTRVIPYRV